MTEEGKPEGVRAWYDRTTKKARRSLVWATLVTMVAAVLIYIFAPHALHLKLQIFNGAYVIPAAGAIWIAAFMFIWLIPMRELSFRSQESIERTENRVQNALQNEIIPAIQIWKRLGEKIERHVDSGLLAEIRTTTSEARVFMKGLDGRLKAIENEVKPAVTEMREAIQEMRAFMGPQPKSQSSVNAPLNFERALSAVRKRTQQPLNHGATVDGRTA